ncbi:MAG: DNA polymerase III subunit alpha [Candidatus Bostrichicola ureolyticus]|nr:MAG: DNA polymerase III subunit alpha [Candidatus Bostrichicola ureolyticus]
MYIIFDTETTGINLNTNIKNFPRIVQIAWQCYDHFGKLINNKNFIIRPEGFDIPIKSTKIHGITTERAYNEGHPIKIVLQNFKNDLKNSSIIIGHNLEFDIKIVYGEFIRNGLNVNHLKKQIIDTQKVSATYCAIPGPGGKYKWPTLRELYYKLFNKYFDLVHNANADVIATTQCFSELIRRGVISHNNKNKFEIDDTINKSEIANYKNQNILSHKFANLHNHTCFSILSSTIDINSLVNKAVDWNMPAVGITDYGNMMGAFYFLNAIQEANKKKDKLIKGVIGSELFLSYNDDKRYNQVFLAKNKKGYHNLSKLCSKGFIYGYYAGIPHINKKLIEKYKEGLIALSGDLNSEIPYTIINFGEDAGEKVFNWWIECFGEDFYIELLRNGIENENYVNNVLLTLAKKYNVKYIVQNNTFYLEQIDANAHDILLCVRYGEKQNTPIGQGKGYRFGLPNNEFYFKSPWQMVDLFKDLPEAFINLDELLSKIEIYKLNKPILVPKFKIPDNFINKYNHENAYLKYLTYKGAKKRYLKLNNIIKERIEYELNTIKNIGYSGYFLIVYDFILHAKKLNICVGPGRGSVAGSVIAYCIGITEIDPIKYDLLFERFLNPDRISRPDIDIDFDDRGRDKIIKWVVKKYGYNHVAKIITYGTMGAKSAIRDTARVLNFPLNETNKITKLVPNNISLKSIYSTEIFVLKEKFNKSEIENILILKKYLNSKKSLKGKIIQQAKIIEGSIRNTGIHACGIIITPLDIKEIIPVAISKDSDLLVTQFNNKIVESAGLLKMDFLGLKTLTIINDTIKLIKKIKNITIKQFPLDDAKTYDLFKKGETIGIFQYESIGMQKYLRKLKPDQFNDLIAMNALYRPGPLQYIPNFIARKHGKEPIVYDLPEMKNILKNTYGITIYQEQVMLLSQKLANFSKGEADILIQAIGKKQKNVLNNIKKKFIEQSIKNGYSYKKIKKIWKDWEAFASYAFNKSHSTCYAYLAFKTAYLKAHYPLEYITSVLSNNMQNIKDIPIFVEECIRIGIEILNPDINKSSDTFIINDNGAIMFSLLAIKGIGDVAVANILRERKLNGIYISIFDFIKRIDLRIINKKILENLILSGAFDSFNIKREQYLNVLENIILFGIKYQKFIKQKKQSLFSKEEIDIKEPIIPHCDPLQNIIKLEKEVLGIK